MRFLTLMTVLSVLGFAVQAPSAEAAYGGITAAANWQHGQPHLGRHVERCGLRCRAGASVCEDCCYTVMKTMTRTVYGSSG